MRNLKTILIRWIRKTLASGKSVEEIAKGAAIGTFVAFMPLFGIQMLLAVPLAVWLRGNRVAALAFVWINNPFTIIPIYTFNYWIGLQLVRSDIRLQRFQAILEGFNTKAIVKYGCEIGVPLLIGSTIAATIGAVMAWVGVRIVVGWYRARRSKPR